MSESATNVEVEDVLSSIRRLVSDDKRPSVAVISEPSNDRLVLTPALRVAGSDEISDNETDHAPEIQAWSDFGASPDHKDALLDSELTDDIPTLDDDEDMLLDPQTEADVDIHDDNNDEQKDHQNQEVTAEVEPEPSMLDSVVETSEPEIVEDVATAEIPVAELLEDQSEAAFFAKSSATLGAKITALETVIGKTDDQWEPDDTGDSDYSGTEAPAMIWDDADPMETVDDDAVPVADSVADFEPQDGFSQSVDDILDEEALRDIVSDIVREELQGALGEQITRNVRKLVRREIHRALTAQDLE
jgi:hypothetical protein|tara:strand:+ start:226 stop:1134 length:909 start_codon:yes stop_codon:yes gene_type:complete